ncbi:MAG TPA: isochorismatase family cysteine hydrolase [Pseudonocardiaceae bacterium]|jgi:nicotinamidase-related amidase|nr:isochorismatase family cysteine hydrolase [Pseudonocardiaceae bacterium]
MDEHTQPHYARSALLTIDLQRDFLSDGGYGIVGTTEVLPAVRRLVAGYRAAGRPIVHVVRLYLPDGSNADLPRRAVLACGASIALPGSPGSQLAEGLAPDEAVELDHDQLLAGQLQRLGPTEHVMFKPRWNAFYATGLDEHLRQAGVDTVVVAGCNYPNCPRGTLFGASERDYRAVLVTDAVSAWNERAGVELGGLGVLTTTTEEVLSQLAASSRVAAPA